MSAGIQARVLHKDQNKVNEILDENLDLSGNTFKFLETENESKTSKIDTKIPTAKFLSECRTAIFNNGKEKIAHEEKCWSCITVKKINDRRREDGHT